MGCLDDTSICGIEVFQSFVHFPSAFTPNGDGFNETFSAIHSATFSVFHLEIYSRWGQKVFESFDPDVGWDGTYKGRSAPEGVYTYVFNGSYMFRESRIERKGTLTLIR
jgi:gliding motility-associated-like protein